MRLGDLADRIHAVLEDDFVLSSADDNRYVDSSASGGRWEPSGDPVEFVIAEIAGLEPEIADDLRELLSRRHAYVAIKDSEEDPYGVEAHYTAKGPADWEFRETWSEFCREIRSRSRFFSAIAEEALNSIFGDLDAHQTSSGRPVVLEISPTDEERFFWRARKAQSIEGLKAILKSTSSEMGPPPSRFATGGRMNASGIPVFYGAFDADTCLTEVRAPVGSHVVVAKFELLRPVRLLDFDALAEVYVPGSHFDPGYRKRQGRGAFLSHLVREVSLPVMPQDEAREHLPTQVVAEFLANRTTFRLDGIVFRSTQTGQVGRNVVLFNRACGVLRSAMPDVVEIKVFTPCVHADDEEDDLGFISVLKSVPPDSAGDETVSPVPTGSAIFEAAAFSAPQSDDSEREASDDPASDEEPTLRLDDSSVVVRKIRGVQYQYSCSQLIRLRRTNGDEVEF